MRKIGFWIAGIFLAISLWVPSAPAAEGKDVLERLPSGVINWTQGIVTAKGSGAPPTGITIISQARLMAERAAKADALRNLLEAVKGVRVDAQTTVESFAIKSDMVMTRVSGIVKGATVVDKRYLSDGGVEVTVAVYLTGELLAVMLQELPPLTQPLMPAPSIPFIDKPLPPLKPMPLPVPPPLEKKVPFPPQEKKITLPPAAEEKRLPPTPEVPAQIETKKTPATPEVPAQVETKKTAAAPEAPAQVEEKLDLKKLEYTGLIVDARKLSLRPALIPKILNQKGELVYSSQSIAQQELVKMGLVGYAKDVDAASKNQRVTAEPCIINGLTATGEKKTDVVISNRDAQIVLTTAPYTGYLKNGRVMIVYD
jgi:hypothetical protein